MKTSPPQPPRIDHTVTRHGERVVDSYHWMRDREQPRVLAHLEAENAFTEQQLAGTHDARKRLYDEMLSRIKETDLSVPERFGGYFYYSRTEQGKPYRIHCRKQGSLDAPEQLLLDENLLASTSEYFRLGVARVSPDHGLLAYSVDRDGSERYTLRIRDLARQQLPDEIEGAYASAVWSADGRVLFYTMLDEAHRPFRVMRHVLGSAPSADQLVHEEADEAFHVGIYRTKDERYVMLSLDSNTTSEVRFIDARQPLSSARVLWPRRHEVEYSVEHHQGHWLILTNQDAVNFRLMRAAVGKEDEPEEILAHEPEVLLEDIEVFTDHVAVFERRAGVGGIRIFDLPSWRAHTVELPEPVRVVYPTRNPESDSRQLRFVYSSLITPHSVFDYEMATRGLELKKETEVVGGYDRQAYATERLHARAEDGTEVPISLVYRRDCTPEGEARPLLLYGYGAYGICVDPAFDSRRLSLLDRGVVHAIAHVRGGGDLGRPWYKAGKLQHKRNSFTDLIACAELLIGSGRTAADRLAIRGGSAGGLLVGAAANMRPELFRAVVARVPFVDVVNTLCDESLPLTVTEWEEWGDPRQRVDHDYIRSYSPYDNVVTQAYPHMLITGGLNDPRVAFWEPAKWVARLRDHSTGEAVILLKMDLGAGHGGPSGRYASLEDLAFEYAFLLDRLGIDI